MYERSRPGYPDGRRALAHRWSQLRPCDVVDLGAGTGKLTRSLVDLGHRVTAVEPLAEMLDQLRAGGSRGDGASREEQRRSRFRRRAPTSSRWRRHSTGSTTAPRCVEIARVLRPGGHVALVWNVRDESEPLVSELSDAMVGRTGVDRGAVEPIDASGLFGPVEHATFGHVQAVDRETLRELVLSRSYCAVLSEEERAPVLQNVDDLFTEHARDGVVRLPYLTECFRATRR